MTLTLTPADQQMMVEAGYSISEVEAMTYCECGSGEPAVYGSECGACWVEGQEL